MTQDRSTPLESVVEEAREFAVELELNAVIERDRDETAPLIRRLADRVEELEAALGGVVEVVEALIVSPHVQVRSIRPRMERARQALSTQPEDGMAHQWCLVHDIHQDDPRHDYDYSTCEGHHRPSTPAEDAALSTQPQQDKRP